MGSRDNYIISSVQKALLLLKLFDNETREMTLTEISAQMGLTKSSTLRLLTTLHEEGFIAYDEANKKYSLGIQLSILGGYQNNAADLRKIAAPYLQEIADYTHSICNLAVVRDKNILIVEKVFPREVPTWAQLMAESATCFPLYSTGVGRLHMAQWKDEEVLNYLNNITIPKYTEHTITDKNRLYQIILQVREDGYVLNPGENEISTSSICVPIYDCDGIITSGISISGIPDLIFSRATEYAAVMKKAALKISYQIGYNK